VFIFAHIGNQGDRTDPIGWMRSLKSTDHIQGFAIETLEDTGCDILYRGRLADGGWTDWKTKGELAGARGTAEGLTGISVRTGHAGRDDFSLEIIGEFSGAAAPVTVLGGEDCLPGPGGGALTGLQVILRKAG
jgi:hypothetical protein